MKRVLLTGAAGFVGANLARRLVRDGHAVHLLLRPGHDAWRLEEITRHVTVHVTDLSDFAAVAAAVARARPAWIFHLAAYGAYARQTDLRRMVEANVVGTAALLEAALGQGFEAFVQAGSSSEYGLKAEPPREDSWLEPNSDYAATKAASTLLTRQLARRLELPMAILRLYSVYGAWEEPSRLIPSLVTRAMRGQLPPLVDPTVARDFVYVDDVVEAFLLLAADAARHRGAVFNVGTGTQTTIREVVAAACRVFDVTVEPAWGSMPNRAWDTTAWVADSSLIRSKLGWRPGTSLDDGLRAMRDWLEATPRVRARYF